MQAVKAAASERRRAGARSRGSVRMDNIDKENGRVGLKIETGCVSVVCPEDLVGSLALTAGGGLGTMFECDSSAAAP